MTRALLTKNTQKLIVVETGVGIDSSNHAISGGRLRLLLQDLTLDQCENSVQDHENFGCKKTSGLSAEATDNINILYLMQNTVTEMPIEGVEGHPACCHGKQMDLIPAIGDTANAHVACAGTSVKAVTVVNSTSCSKANPLAWVLGRVENAKAVRPTSFVLDPCLPCWCGISPPSPFSKGIRTPE